MSKWVPGLAVAREYDRSWLRHDVVAGLVLTAVLIPAGIGYAEVSGLPAVTGLYATIVPLLAYALFGPSRLLVLGPDSALAPIIAVSVAPLAAGDPDRAVALAGLLALMMGVLLLLGGLFRLGFVTDLLSKPIRLGYLNAIALVVIIGQLPKLFGFSLDDGSAVDEVRGFVAGLFEGDGSALASTLGTSALVGIIGIGIMWSRAAGVVAAVVVSMVATAVAGWRDDVSVVGVLPSGLPAPALDGLTWGDAWSLVGPAFGIALIAFADTSVLSRVFAVRHDYRVSGDDEMRAIGAANIASGAFGGFPVSASSSRTPVAEQAGGRTQLVGVVGAMALVGFILFAPDLTSYLPSSVLAAIVIVAASSLVDVHTFATLLRVDRLDAALAAVAFLGVVLVGVLEGIVIAVALSLIAFVNQAWRPYRTELGRRHGVRGYHDLSRHPYGEVIEGVVIVRFDAPLFFANAGLFAEYVRSCIADREAVKYVILAAEPITSVDSTAVDELVQLDDALARAGIELVIAEMKGPVKDDLERRGLGARFGPDRFAPTVGAAVDRITGSERGDIGRPSDRS
ncbi:MAG TPA: SulP family inorganic anion transporter [Ilumatobacter sp.]|nr:SulP family inorganic anion transporter [Ilumatobacter sp.]